MQIEEEVISPQGLFVFPSEDLHQMMRFPSVCEIVGGERTFSYIKEVRCLLECEGRRQHRFL